MTETSVAKRAASIVTRGFTESETRGCQFCGSKSIKFDSGGREWWHSSRDCCGPMIALQICWRYGEMQQSWRLRETLRVELTKANEADRAGIEAKLRATDRLEGVKENGPEGWREEIHDLIAQLHGFGSSDDAMNHLRQASEYLPQDFSVANVRVWIETNWLGGRKQAKPTIRGRS